MIRNILGDLRYGARVLLKSSGFTAVAVVTLGLGIGANTAIFSVVDAVLFRPLPYPEPHRLVTVWTRNRELDFARGGTSLQDFQDWRSRCDSFESIGVHVSRDGIFSTGREPIKIQYALTDPELFEAPGVPPQLGRLFEPGENDPGADSVAIVSDGLWRELFGAEPSVFGRDVFLGGQRLTIVGVMPAGFGYPTPEVRMWKPFGMKPDDAGSRDGRWVYATARLRRGTTLEAADRDLRRVAAELAAEYPKTNAGFEAFVEPLLATAGVAAGLGSALLLSWILESVLFDVRGNDPVTLATASAVLLAAAVAASIAPALKAVRADPVSSLRSR